MATHPGGPTKTPIGIERDGVVYDLFFTTLPQGAFTAADVMALYLHRGAFETELADEDVEQGPDRWCSHSACGQETWQILSQWVWHLRLELGYLVEPTALRSTEFAPALPPSNDAGTPVAGYGAAEVGLSWKQGRFCGHDFVMQPDGTLRCPAGQTLCATEQRRDLDGSLRLVYAARIRQCRSCTLREHCQWHGPATLRPRRVSVLLHPLLIGPAPLLWSDWSRRQHRRVCRHLLLGQRVDIQVASLPLPAPEQEAIIVSRAQRAHYRLSWQERLARNALAPLATQVRITLFGVPNTFATLLGLAIA